MMRRLNTQLNVITVGIYFLLGSQLLTNVVIISWIWDHY